MSKLESKKLFNPKGDDSVENRKMIFGNPTNLINLNNAKYPWTNNLYRGMMENFWIPEKINLMNDKVDFAKLPKADQRAYNGILSFLVFLDSIQTNNLPNISNYITDPSVSLLLSVQTYQEAVHSQSYSYIIESIFPKEEKDLIYELWRKDKKLFSRNEYIASIYQKLLDDPSPENFGRAVFADYLLEGIYFYNGFNFFYNLARRNLMIGTKDIIKLIHRDEQTHCVLFERIIQTIRKENPEILTEETMYEMAKVSVQHEIEWGQHIIGDDILGMSPKSIEQFTHWMGNHRLKKLGLKEIFPEVKENPFKHLNQIADVGGGGEAKGNFFEAKVTSYNQASVIKGWDKLDEE